MKKKYLAILLGLVMSMSIISSGCGSSAGTEENSVVVETDTTEKEGKQAKMDEADVSTEKVLGEVKSITDDTIEIVTRTFSGKQESENQESEKQESENKDSNNEESESGQEETDETKKIKLNDNTVIKRRTGGGMRGGMKGGMNGQGTPPEMPGNGDSGNESGNEGKGTPPKMPGSSEAGSESGNEGKGTPPEMPGNNDSGNDTNAENDTENLEEISASDIAEGDLVEITFAEDGTASEITVIPSDGMGQPGEMGQPGGQSQNGVDSYASVKEYTTDTTVKGETITSTGTDENAVLVSEGASVSLSGLTVNRTSDDSTGGDNASFYGVGAAILATDGSVTVEDSTIETDADGAAGVFAYGDGTASVSDTKIHTTQDASGGIHVAGGGTLYASNLDVVTEGQSSAAIRSDRGGGTMTVEGGSYTSNGVGSPAVYSTADISISDAALTANGSEAVCIEGLNSLKLTNCNLTGNMSDSSQNDCTWNVILYQSMSGDSEVGNSTFEMTGGTLTAKNGGMFYTTNTESTFVLNNVEITYADDNEFFLRCTGNQNERGWGSTGSNGADCDFTAIRQQMQGDIIWDSISNLDFHMTEGSILTGAVIDDESCAGDGGEGYCNLDISADSTWIVTGDSTLSKLSCAGTITDASGNTVTITGTDGTVYVTGTSSYTITVDSYETSV